MLALGAPFLSYRVQIPRTRPSQKHNKGNHFSLNCNPHPHIFFTFALVMKAIFTLLVFYLVGGAVSWATGGLLPASIVGMILLFAALWLGWLKPEKVKPATDFLLGNLMLFFVPVAVGVVGSFVLFKDHIWAILTSSVVSTVIVVAVVGAAAQFLIKRKERKS